MIENVLPDDPTPKPLLTTPLDAWHRRFGARMVEFAGYAMPVQYDFSGDLKTRCRGGVLAEHLADFSGTPAELAARLIEEY